MAIQLTPLPQPAPRPIIDQEIYWPSVSARYNISLSEISDVIYASEPHLGEDGPYQRIPTYLAALIYADSLWGEDILSLLLTINRNDAIRAMVLALEQPLHHCMGMDTEPFLRSLRALVGPKKPTIELAHAHLATVLIHWAWLSPDIRVTSTILTVITDKIDLLMFHLRCPFPVFGFTNLLRHSFQPRHFHPMRDLSHGQPLNP